jgi:glycosyltransferase involved in cell wall biosynthesis
VRITFLSWRDRTHPDGGGSEVFVERVAAGLVELGHEVTVLCAAHPGLTGRAVRDGFTLLPRGGRLTVYLHGLWFLLTARGRRQDVVVDLINGLPFGAPLVRRRGVVALVHHVHREQWRIIYPGLAGRIGWFVESRVVPRLYRRVPVVTVSEASRSDLVSLGFAATRLDVVRNGTPELPSPRTGRASSPRLCVLSRLVPHKQVEHAVDLVQELGARGVEVSLDLIGDGWWSGEIDRYITERGLQDRVVRHGRVDEQTKADLLAGAWLMVLPSVKEGWGIAVMEAARVGTPTVAYRTAGGTAESIVHGETGVLVDSRAQLCDAVEDLLRDDARRQSLGAEAQAWARSLTWAETTARFEKVLGRAYSP